MNASEGRSSDSVATEKAKGGGKSGESSTNERPVVHSATDDVPAVDSGEDDSSSSSSISSTPISEGFEGYARVFFQGRNDRVSTQLQPTNSSTLARDSYLYIEVDPDATELRIYPGKDEKGKLIVDPPINLKYFYAARVPGSNEGSALFLKEDDREYQRYIFRFEFRNDKNLQPAARMYQLAHCSKAAKNAQRMNWTMRNKFGIAPKTKRHNKTKEQDTDETLRAQKKESQEILNAYIGTIEDLTREGLVAAESFVDLVNSAITGTEEGTSWGRPRRNGTSWGAGYADVESENDDDDSDSDWSDETDGQYDDDEDESGTAKAGEKIEESFERVFGALSKRSRDV